MLDKVMSEAIQSRKGLPSAEKSLEYEPSTVDRRGRRLLKEWTMIQSRINSTRDCRVVLKLGQTHELAFVVELGSWLECCLI